MPFIDGHLHVWEGRHPDRPYPWTPDPFPAEALLPVLDDSDVDGAVHVSPVIVGYDNSYGVEVATRYPDRFAVFGRFDALQPDVGDALQHWMQQPGSAGVRFTAYRESEGDRLDGKPMRPFWEAAAAHAVPVAVFAPGRLDEILSIARAEPALTLIVDHFGLGVFGGADDPFAGVEDLGAFADMSNVFVKVSALPEVSREPFPFPDVHRHLDWAAATFGPERLIWGSNWPVESIACSYREAWSWIPESGVLDGDGVDRVLGRTMAGILGWTDRGPDYAADPSPG
jgi:predicted TIM-barrel fold metal-dependent hydrolase